MSSLLSVCLSTSHFPIYLSIYGSGDIKGYTRTLFLWNPPKAQSAIIPEQQSYSRSAEVRDLGGVFSKDRRFPRNCLTQWRIH